jgi:hypothetical protein
MPRKVTEIEIRRQLAKASARPGPGRSAGSDRREAQPKVTQTSPSGTDALTDAPAPLASPQMHPSRPCACARRPRGRRETVSLCAGVPRVPHTSHDSRARSTKRAPEHDTDCGDPRRSALGPVKAQGSRAPVSGWTFISRDPNARLTPAFNADTRGNTKTCSLLLLFLVFRDVITVVYISSSDTTGERGGTATNLLTDASLHNKASACIVQKKALHVFFE